MNSTRSASFLRLDDERVCEPGGLALELAAGRDHGEARHANAVVVQDLLRQRLVAGEHQAAGVAAGIGDAHEFEKAHHVLVEHRLPVEFLQQIEDDVGLEVLDGPAQRRQVVVEPERLDLVPLLAQAGHHVVLGLVLDDLRVGLAGDVVGRHQIGVHQHEHPLLAHA